jgi:hypothetical protein
LLTAVVARRVLSLNVCLVVSQGELTKERELRVEALTKERELRVEALTKERELRVVELTKERELRVEAEKRFQVSACFSHFLLSPTCSSRSPL